MMCSSKNVTFILYLLCHKAQNQFSLLSILLRYKDQFSPECIAPLPFFVFKLSDIVVIFNGCSHFEEFKACAMELKMQILF